MGHQNHALEVFEPLLEHLERRDIKIVRRLVEHRDVGGLEHDAGDVDALPRRR